MIAFKNVRKYFDKNQVMALDQINLEINYLDIFGFIGKSGAGKSTLLRLINGLEYPTSGQVLVEGEVINELSAKKLKENRRRIGMIFQNFNLIHSKTVYKNVAYPLEIQNEKVNEIEKKVEKVLKLVGLSHKIHAYPSQLSGGEKQRVAIARSIINEPRILLCDEATSALDPETTRSILRLLKKINQELEITIVLITHEMKVIRGICNRVGVLEKGRLIDVGEIEDILYSKKSHPVTKELIAVESCIS